MHPAADHPHRPLPLPRGGRASGRSRPAALREGRAQERHDARLCQRPPRQPVEARDKRLAAVRRNQPGLNRVEMTTTPRSASSPRAPPTSTSRRRWATTPPYSSWAWSTRCRMKLIRDFAAKVEQALRGRGAGRPSSRTTAVKPWASPSSARSSSPCRASSPSSWSGTPARRRGRTCTAPGGRTSPSAPPGACAAGCPHRGRVLRPARRQGLPSAATSAATPWAPCRPSERHGRLPSAWAPPSAALHGFNKARGPRQREEDRGRHRRLHLRPFRHHRPDRHRLQPGPTPRSSSWTTPSPA